MKRLFANRAYEAFAEGAARAAFVQAWAYEREEKGKRLGRGDLMQQAPPTPLSAYVFAGELIGKMEALNAANLYQLMKRADDAEGHDISLQDFGHYCAMQALGQGVSWFDSHASFPLKLPHMEYALP